MPNCGMAERLRAALFASAVVLGVAICVTRRIDRIRSRNREKIAELQLNLTVFGAISLDMRLMVQPKERLSSPPRDLIRHLNCK